MPRRMSYLQLAEPATDAATDDGSGNEERQVKSIIVAAGKGKATFTAQGALEVNRMVTFKPARWIPKSEISPFMPLDNELKIGVRLWVLPGEHGLNITREQKRSCREFFKSITDRVPGLFNYLTNPDRAVKDIEGAISLVWQYTQNSRIDDASKLKPRAKDYVFLNRSLNFNDPDKNDRGVYCSDTARLFWPAKRIEEFDADPEGSINRLLGGEIEMKAKNYLLLLYEDYTYDPADPFKGLFLSRLVICTWISIFIAPELATRWEEVPSANRGVAKKYGMKYVTPESMGYAILHAIFATSSAKDWRREIYGIDLHRVYLRCVGALKDLEDPWAVATLERLNTIMFGHPEGKRSTRAEDFEAESSDDTDDPYAEARERRKCTVLRPASSIDTQDDHAPGSDEANSDVDVPDARAAKSPSGTTLECEDTARQAPSADGDSDSEPADGSEHPGVHRGCPTEGSQGSHEPSLHSSAVQDGINGRDGAEHASSAVEDQPLRRSVSGPSQLGEEQPQPERERELNEVPQRTPHAEDEDSSALSEPPSPPPVARHPRRRATPTSPSSAPSSRMLKALQAAQPAQEPSRPIARTNASPGPSTRSRPAPSSSSKKRKAAPSSMPFSSDDDDAPPPAQQRRKAPVRKPKESSSTTAASSKGKRAPKA